jgi:SulP family sulfate permease
VVFNVIDRFGYGGLILCTLLAGIMLIAAGVLRLGTLLKYIPQPVITGFTSRNRRQHSFQPDKGPARPAHG